MAGILDMGVYVKVKIEQPDSCLNKMLSSDRIQLKMMLENNEEQKIKVNIILHFVIEKQFSY
jgi:hypothetical protein